MSPHTRRQFLGIGTNAFWFAVGGVTGYFFERFADSKLDPAGPLVNPFPADVISERLYNGSLIQGSPESVGNPPNVYDTRVLEAWADRRKGIDAITSAVYISIQTREQPILLERVRVVVSKRTDPPTGVHLGPLGSGSFYLYSALADLDKEPVDVTPSSDDNPDWTFPVLIDPNHIFAMEVVAMTEQSLAEWRIEIDYLLGGVKKVLKIMDGRKPFVVTSASAATHEWSHQEQRWIER